MAEHTPTLADMLEGLVYSQLELGKQRHADPDLITAENELRRQWAEALAAHDAEVRADERPKRPDREQVARRLYELRLGRHVVDETWVRVREEWGTWVATCFRDTDAVLALEPEASEERPDRTPHNHDDSTIRGLIRGEEVLRGLEHHWAADSVTQAIEELRRLRDLIEAREEDEDQLNRAEHEPLAYDGTHVGGPDYNEVRPTVIARLEGTRGDLTEYPIAEKARGGWQNGVTFYPDADVTQVKVPYVPAPEAREVTDAGIDAARAVITALAPYNMELRPDGSEDREAAAYVSGVMAASDAIPEALRAAREVSRGS